MYKRILVATDGSDISKRAAGEAVALARALGAEVIVVSVLDTRALLSAYPGVPQSVAPVYPGLIDELRKVASAANDEVVTQCKATPPVRAESEVREGTPASAILETAEKRGVDLIVMGTHGRSGFGALLLGSTAQSVLHRAKVPVLLVR